MQIQTNVPLKDYSTMRLGDDARALAVVRSTDELIQAIAWAEQQKLPHLVLGGGSNVIFKDGYNGLVIINRIPGFHILHEDDSGATIKIGSGENWDSIVERTVKMNLSGIEKLSAIPGTVGGTPVQNVGAYGAEIADTFVELTAYDLNSHKFAVLRKQDCKFSYRNSIFKSPANRHYIITDVTLRLQKTNPQPPFYDSLQRYLDAHDITSYTPQIIRDAVIAVRHDRLPDPARIANTGSFFKNPIVPRATYEKIANEYPDAPHWEMADGKVKLSAGWLIEHADLKNHQSHGMRLFEHNALVVINEHARNYSDLAAFRQEIIDGVKQRFAITLVQEPELL